MNLEASSESIKPLTPREIALLQSYFVKNPGKAREILATIPKDEGFSLSTVATEAGETGEQDRVYLKDLFPPDRAGTHYDRLSIIQTIIDRLTENMPEGKKLVEKLNSLILEIESLNESEATEDRLRKVGRSIREWSEDFYKYLESEEFQTLKKSTTEIAELSSNDDHLFGLGVGRHFNKILEQKKFGNKLKVMATMIGDSVDRNKMLVLTGGRGIRKPVKKVCSFGVKLEDQVIEKIQVDV